MKNDFDWSSGPATELTSLTPQEEETLGYYVGTFRLKVNDAGEVYDYHVLVNPQSGRLLGQRTDLIADISKNALPFSIIVIEVEMMQKLSKLATQDRQDLIGYRSLELAYNLKINRIMEVYRSRMAILETATAKHV